jgi:hypothetical protein
MPAEAEVIGVKDVLKGLSFIDEDMYRVRISTAIDPLMRAGSRATAKGLCA